MAAILLWLQFAFCVALGLRDNMNNSEGCVTGMKDHVAGGAGAIQQCCSELECAESTTFTAEMY
jgi:hypothetical protein